MSIKSRARKLGRMVRKITGIHLVTAMQIGKYIAQGKDAVQLIARFPAHIRVERGHCSYGCSGCEDYIVLSGPKGFVTDYAISESTLTRELSIREKFAPSGTTANL